MINSLRNCLSGKIILEIRPKYSLIKKNVQIFEDMNFKQRRTNILHCTKELEVKGFSKYLLRLIRQGETRDFRPQRQINSQTSPNIALHILKSTISN